MKMRLALAVGLSLSHLAVAGVALADDPPTPAAPAASGAPVPAGDWTPNATRQRIELNWDVFPSDGLFVMTWDVGAHLQVAKEVFQPGDSILAGARYAWGYLNVSNAGDQATYGNPSLGARYTLPLDKYVPDLRAYGGFYWTPPVLSEPELAVALTAAIGATTRGFFDGERLVPGATAFRFDFGAEYRIMPNLYYRGTLNPVIYVPTRSGGDTELILEQGNEAEYRLDFGLGGGLRFQEAFTLTDADLVQLATELFVAYTPEGTGFYGRFGFLLALDQALGFDGAEVHTLRFTAGYQLD